MPALNSSWILWVEFNLGTMELTLRNGRTYTLRGVPEYHFVGLVNASSPGTYFNTYLKGHF